MKEFPKLTFTVDQINSFQFFARTLIRYIIPTGHIELSEGTVDEIKDYYPYEEQLFKKFINGEYSWEEIFEYAKKGR